MATAHSKQLKVVPGSVSKFATFNQFELFRMHVNSPLHAVATRTRASSLSVMAGVLPTQGPTAVHEGALSRSVVIGILGGGQLGKMLALEAAKMGIKVKVLDPTPGCPASTVAEQVVGSFRDADAVKRFASDVDVLTVEIEHIDADAMEAATSASGIEVQPTPNTIRIIQDKFRQKQHFAESGVPLPEFREIKCARCAASAGDAFGFPYMLKSKTLAYDGRGNAVVDSPEGIESAVAALGGYEKGL